jgi:hypothetical protein
LFFYSVYEGIRSGGYGLEAMVVGRYDFAPDPETFGIGDEPCGKEESENDNGHKTDAATDKDGWNPADNIPYFLAAKLYFLVIFHYS